MGTGFQCSVPVTAHCPAPETGNGIDRSVPSALASNLPGACPIGAPRAPGQAFGAIPTSYLLPSSGRGATRRPSFCPLSVTVRTAMQSFPTFSACSAGCWGFVGGAGGVQGHGRNRSPLGAGGGGRGAVEGHSPPTHPTLPHRRSRDLDASWAPSAAPSSIVASPAADGDPTGALVPVIPPLGQLPANVMELVCSPDAQSALACTPTHPPARPPDAANRRRYHLPPHAA